MENLQDQKERWDKMIVNYNGIYKLRVADSKTILHDTII